MVKGRPLTLDLFALELALVWALSPPGLGFPLRGPRLRKQKRAVGGRGWAGEGLGWGDAGNLVPEGGALS